MDNLTHSLIGAALGQAGLKRRTGLAMPALIIGANLPDVDAACFFWLEGTEHLGFRRGITHGTPAMVLLPLILAALLWWFDRWQAARGTRPGGRLPVSFKWLYLLSLIGTLSHPLFDWFNNYGIRFLEPFSSIWFYGDVLFIIDVWVIAMLGSGVWFSLQRERVRMPEWTQPARVACLSVTAYVALNYAISGIADGWGLVYDGPSETITNPVPITFWKREVLWRDDGWLDHPQRRETYGKYDYSLFDMEEDSSFDKRVPTNLADPRIAQWAKGNPQAEAFLFWSRMPVAELHDDRIVLRDQRFMDSPAAASFTVTLLPPGK